MPDIVYAENRRYSQPYPSDIHAETGRGLGASHQTGWTALIVNCLHKLNALSD